MDTIAFFYIVKLIADQMRDMMAYKMNLMNMMAYMMRQAAMVSHWWWETGSWWVFRTWQSLSEVLSLSHNIQSFFCRKDTAKVMKTLREKVMSTGVTKQRRKRRMKKYLMKCFWTKHFSSRLWSFIKRESKWPEFGLLEKNSAFDRDPVPEVHSPRACLSLRTSSPVVLSRQNPAWRKDHWCWFPGLFLVRKSLLRYFDQWSNTTYSIWLLLT